MTSIWNRMMLVAPSQPARGSSATPALSWSLLLKMHYGLGFMFIEGRVQSPLTAAPPLRPPSTRQSPPRQVAHGPGLGGVHGWHVRLELPAHRWTGAAPPPRPITRPHARAPHSKPPSPPSPPGTRRHRQHLRSLERLVKPLESVTWPVTPRPAPGRSPPAPGGPSGDLRFSPPICQRDAGWLRAIGAPPHAHPRVGQFVPGD